MEKNIVVSITVEKNGVKTGIMNSLLERFGFRFKKSSVHTARTMMLDDLSLLLKHVSAPDASWQDYWKAIKEDNCLGKRSVKSRTLSAKHLKQLYSLEPSVLLFRSLRYFWSRDEKGQPLFAFLCSYARDTILRISAPLILELQEGSIISRTDMESFIDNIAPGRFSKATLKSIAQNLNGTWTSSGHLRGRKKKFRVKAHPSAGSVSYALLLGYINGIRGVDLFRNEYMRLLDCSEEIAMELAAEASRRGWIVFKRIDTVMEVDFPNLLTAEERRWVYEQS